MKDDLCEFRTAGLESALALSLALSPAPSPDQLDSSPGCSLEHDDQAAESACHHADATCADLERHLGDGPQQAVEGTPLADPSWVLLQESRRLFPGDEDDAQAPVEEGIELSRAPELSDPTPPIQFAAPAQLNRPAPPGAEPKSTPLQSSDAAKPIETPAPASRTKGTARESSRLRNRARTARATRLPNEVELRLLTILASLGEAYCKDVSLLLWPSSSAASLERIDDLAHRALLMAYETNPRIIPAALSATHETLRKELDKAQRTRDAGLAQQDAPAAAEQGLGDSVPGKLRAYVKRLRLSSSNAPAAGSDKLARNQNATVDLYTGLPWSLARLFEFEPCIEVPRELWLQFMTIAWHAAMDAPERRTKRILDNLLERGLVQVVSGGHRDLRYRITAAAAAALKTHRSLEVSHQVTSTGAQAVHNQVVLALLSRRVLQSWIGTHCSSTRPQLEGELDGLDAHALDLDALEATTDAEDASFSQSGAVIGAAHQPDESGVPAPDTLSRPLVLTERALGQESSHCAPCGRRLDIAQINLREAFGRDVDALVANPQRGQLELVEAENSAKEKSALMQSLQCIRPNAYEPGEAAPAQLKGWQVKSVTFAMPNIKVLTTLCKAAHAVFVRDEPAKPLASAQENQQRLARLETFLARINIAHVAVNASQRHLGVRLEHTLAHLVTATATLSDFLSLQGDLRLMLKQRNDSQ